MLPEDDMPPHPADAGGTVTPISAAKPKRHRKAKPAALPADERTDLDLSEMLLARSGESLRYCAALGGWFAWDGARWKVDDRGHARECAKDIARTIAAEAAALLDHNLFRAAKRAGSASGVAAILELARTTPGIVFVAEDANRDPWILNVANGAIDLRTGELRQHNRADMVTRVAPVAFDPAATAPTFDRFLTEVQPDPEVRAFLQRLFGYAAVGVVRDHVLGVLWGSGANGKSVLAECVMHVLGDYARPGPSSLLVTNGHHEPHPTDVASCYGSRLVTVHETKRGAAFDASKIKLLTGGDRLTARHMRQDFFSFAPTHTLVMLSNYKPQADASDSALWRRVLLVPFDVVIPEERRDPQLAERIKATEAAGVLRWVVEGALAWQRSGLAPPPVIRDQTAEYRASEDVIAAFMEERTVRLIGARVAAGAFYSAFKTWCEETGSRRIRSNDFAAELLGRGFRRTETSAGRFYEGIGLRADDDHRGGE